MNEKKQKMASSLGGSVAYRFVPCLFLGLWVFTEHGDLRNFLKSGSAVIVCK